MPKKSLSTEDEALRERLGVALRLISSARGFKPAEMAAACGVSLAHQYRIEAGETTPDALYLFKVCQLLGVSIDSLFSQAQAVSGEPPAGARRHRAGAVPTITNHGVIQHQHNAGSNNLQIGQLGVPPRARRR